MSEWIAGAIGAVSGSIFTAILLCAFRSGQNEEQEKPVERKRERDSITDLALLQLHKRICRLERYNCGECAELSGPDPDESFNQFKTRYNETYKRDVEANKWGRDGDMWSDVPEEVRFYAPAAVPPGMWKNRFDCNARKWYENI